MTSSIQCPALRRTQSLPSFDQLKSIHVFLSPFFVDQLKEIGLLDESYHLTFFLDNLPSYLDQNNERKLQALQEIEIGCNDKKGIPFTQYRYFNEFRQFCFKEAGIKLKTYLIKSASAFVIDPLYYLEELIKGFLADKKFNPTLFDKQLEKLKTLNKDRFFLNEINWHHCGADKDALNSLHLKFMREKTDIKKECFLTPFVNHPIQTEHSFGDIEGLGLLSSDDLVISVEEKSIKSTYVNFWQMIIDYSFRLARIEPRHLNITSAYLKAYQLIYGSGKLIDEGCLLEKILQNRIDSSFIDTLLNSAKQIPNSFGYLISALIPLISALENRNETIPKEAFEKCKNALKKALHSKFPHQLFFLDWIEKGFPMAGLYQMALLLNQFKDKSNQIAMHFAENGFMRIFIDSLSLYIPITCTFKKSQEAPFFSSLIPPQNLIVHISPKASLDDTIHALIDTHAVIGKFESVLFTLSIQKKSTPLSESFFQTLLSYLSGAPINHDERRLIASLLYPWIPNLKLNSGNPRNLDWIFPLLSYSPRQGINLWNLSKGGMDESTYFSVFSHLAKLLPKTAFMQLCQEKISSDLYLRILAELIFHENNLVTLVFETPLQDTKSKKKFIDAIKLLELIQSIFKPLDFFQKAFVPFLSYACCFHTSKEFETVVRKIISTLPDEIQALLIQTLITLATVPKSSFSTITRLFSTYGKVNGKDVLYLLHQKNTELLNQINSSLILPLISANPDPFETILFNHITKDALSLSQTEFLHLTDLPSFSFTALDTFITQKSSYPLLLNRLLAIKNRTHDYQSFFKKVVSFIQGQQDLIKDLIPLFQDYPLIKFLYGEIEALDLFTRWKQAVNQFPLTKSEIKKISDLTLVIKGMTVNFDSYKLVASQITFDLENPLSYSLEIDCIRKAHAHSLYSHDEIFQKISRLFLESLSYVTDTRDPISELILSLDFFEFDREFSPSSDIDLANWQQERMNLLQSWIALLNISQEPRHQKHAIDLDNLAPIEILPIAFRKFSKNSAVNFRLLGLKFLMNLIKKTEFDKEIQKECDLVAQNYLLHQKHFNLHDFDPCVVAIKEMENSLLTCDLFHEMTIKLLDSWAIALKKNCHSQNLTSKISFLEKSRFYYQVQENVKTAILTNQSKLQENTILYTEFLGSIYRLMEKQLNTTTIEVHNHDPLNSLIRQLKLSKVDKIEILKLWKSLLFQSEDIQRKSHSFNLDNSLTLLVETTQVKTFFNFIKKREEFIYKKKRNGRNSDPHRKELAYLFNLANNLPQGECEKVQRYITVRHPDLVDHK